MHLKATLLAALLCCLPLLTLSALPILNVTSSANGGTGSFRALVGGSSPGDTITFDPSIFGDTIDIASSSIAVLHDLSIQGPGPNLLTITSSNDARRIMLVFDGTVDISGLTFANSELLVDGVLVDRGGAAIATQASADLTLTDCVFNGNRSVASDPAVSVDGGAVHAKGNLTITDCRFLNNEADHATGLAQGGAIYGEALLQVTSSFAQANTARGVDARGGLIRALGTCQLGGNNLLDAAAESTGSGFAEGGTVCASGALTATSTLFEFSFATSVSGTARGGAVFAEDDALLEGCRVFATNASSAGDARGGVIYAENTLTLRASTIHGSGATSTSGNALGGAICAEDATLVSISTISDCRASTQDGQAGGAAFAAVNPAAQITVEYATVYQNDAILTGSGSADGPVFSLVSGSQVFVSNTIMAANTADGVPGVSNQAVTSQGYNLVGVGDGFFVAATGDLVGTLGSPIDPALTALTDSLGFASGHLLTEVSPAINAGDPVDFTTDQYGRSVVAGRRDIGAVESDFIAPVISYVVTTLADAGPGSLRDVVASAPAGATITFDTALYGGTITVSGAAILTTVPLTIEGPGDGLIRIVSSNSQRRTMTITANCTLDGLVFADSEAEVGPSGLAAGGGVLGIAPGAEVLIKGCTFSNNRIFSTEPCCSTSLNGAAILNEGILHVRNTNFLGNYTDHWVNNTVRGVAIKSDGPLTIDSCAFIDNEMFFDPGFFGPEEGNGLGGAVFCSADLIVRNSSFQSNSANLQGGAIHGSGKIVLEGCQFSGNRAGPILGGVFSSDTGAGGAIFASDSLTATNCSFSSNFASGYFYGDGGAIFGTTVDAEGCNFSGNSSFEGVGGAIVTTNLDVDSCEFASNISGSGGAVSCSGVLNTISRSTFRNNWVFELEGVESLGGAIRFSGAVLNIDRSTISNNSAGTKGGGIATTNASAVLSIRRSTIAGNTAENGGGIYAESVVDLSNTIVAGNTASVQFNDLDPTKFGSTGYNLIGILEGTPFATGSGDILGSIAFPIDPMLLPPADNGGGLFTQEPDPCSPAFNAGDPADLAPDQIGQAVFDGTRDIGAFERQSGGCSPACSTASPPVNLSHSVLAGSIKLQWDPIANSVACQVQGTRIVPPGPTGSRSIAGVEPAMTNVPFSILGFGTSWTWKVRCACSTSPLNATTFSITDTFAVPVLNRVVDELPKAINLFPNPASDLALLDLQGYGDETVEIRLVAMDGRVLLARRVDVLTNWRIEELNLHGVAPGMYRVSVVRENGKQSLPLVVVE